MALIGRTTRFTATTKIVTSAPNRTLSTATRGGEILRPKMVQVAGDLEFEFPFGLSNFSHDVGAVQFDELTRPLQLPLLQTTAGTLQKVSFDFIVARRGDGVGATIDDELATLQNFAAEDNSVIFVGVHQMMATSVTAWKIQSMSVQVTRVNETGQSVSAQVNMSCTEATDQLERFLTLPKFTYKNPRGTGKGNDDKPPGDNASLLIYNFWLRLTVDAKDDLNEKGKENTLREGLNRLATQYGGESNVLDILVKATRGQYGADKLFNLLETALKNNPTTSVRAGSGK